MTLFSRIKEINTRAFDFLGGLNISFSELCIGKIMNHVSLSADPILYVSSLCAGFHHVGLLKHPKASLHSKQF